MYYFKSVMFAFQGNGTFFVSQFTLMMINLHKIFTRYSWRNTNSKYFNKIWLL